MPFVTEELWSKLGERAHYPLITARWPEPGAAVDAEATAEVEWLIQFIAEVRSIRTALGASAKPMKIFVSSATNERFQIFDRNILQIKRMTRATEVWVRTPEHGLRQIEEIAASLGGNASMIIAIENEGEVQLVSEGLVGRLDFFGEVDVADARTRFEKALEISTKEAKSLEGRLSNPAFVEKAKPEAVEKARADHAGHAAEAERLAAALARLG